MTPWRSTPPTSTWWRRERRTFWRSTPALPERGFSPLSPVELPGGVGGLVARGGFAQTFFFPAEVLGLTFRTPKGRRVRAGGVVVKNVQGYDLVRLFVGSFGLLGRAEEVVLRLRPGRAQAFLRRPFSGSFPRLVPTPGSSSPSRTRKARGSTPTTSATPRRWSGSGRPSGGGGPAFGPEAPLPPRPGPGGGAPLGPALPLPGRRRLSSPAPGLPAPRPGAVAGWISRRAQG